MFHERLLLKIIVFLLVGLSARDRSTDGRHIKTKISFTIPTTRDFHANKIDQSNKDNENANNETLNLEDVPKKRQRRSFWRKIFSAELPVNKTIQDSRGRTNLMLQQFRL